MNSCSFMILYQNWPPIVESGSENDAPKDKTTTTFKTG